MFKMFYFLKFYMLLALLVPIVCSNSETHTTRRNRSSHIDTSDVISDNPKRLVDARVRDTRAKDSYRQHDTESKDINAKIKEIFVVPPDGGIHLFNNMVGDTAATTMVHHSMPADDPMIMPSSISSSLASLPSASHKNSAEIFKVQRTPDGKLNVIFNESLILQTKTTSRPGNDRITFPDMLNKPHYHQLQQQNYHQPHPLKSTNKFNCEDADAMYKGFCTKVRNYPQLDQLENILQREYSSFFGEDVAQPQNISTRMNDPDEEELCRGNEKVIYPEAGEAKDSNWFLIVNRDNYKQGVLIELCSEENQPCRYTENLRNGYRTYCKQHYIYRQMLAIRDNTTVSKEYFKMPSCCKCVLKKS